MAIPAPPPAQPQAGHAGRKARFIAPEAVQSTLHPSADGKLPELRLTEREEASRPAQSQRSTNPLVLVLVLCLSVVASIVLVMYEPGSSGPTDSERRDHARWVIQEDYFSNLDKSKPLEPYQIRLRQAQQASSRGDLAAEHRLYKEVLDMLRAERGAYDRGLTGSRSRDAALEDQLTILLGD